MAWSWQGEFGLTTSPLAAVKLCDVLIWKPLRNRQHTQMSFFSLRRTWTICTRALEYRHKGWCEFMATFLLPGARAAIFPTEVGAVHPNRLGIEFSRAGD